MTASASLPLADILALRLPRPDETAYLRACLLDGDAARSALADWLSRVGDPRLALINDHRGLKALLPLLYDNLQASRTELSAGLSVYLKSAYLREELRGETFRRLSEPALGLLAQADLRLMPVRAVALVPTAYAGRWALRHCHDVDLLVDSVDFARAEAILRGAGFKAAQLPDRVDLTLQNEAGLTISLHQRALPVESYRLPFDELWARAQTIDLPGGRFRAPSAEDMLLHLCAHAFIHRGLKRLHWPVDVYRLLRATPALDWDAVIERADVYGLALPVAAGLCYVGGALSGNVPAAALDRLAQVAARTPPVGQETLFYGTFVGTGVRPGASRFIHLLRRSSARRALLRWLLLPSPSYLRLVERRRGALPLIYAARPLRIGGLWARSRIRSLLQPGHLAPDANAKNAVGSADE